MLGRRVVEQMSEMAEVLQISARSDGSTLDPMLAELDEAQPDWVINCAGQLDAADPDLFLVNSLLPQRLALRWTGRVILASSDAVFTSRGHRAVSEPPDATDAYGESKRLGEAPGAHIIRCSIVDPAGGLLSRAAASVQFTGYTNHLWNGITTASWAAIALKIIRGDLQDTIQPASPVVTKYELLVTAARVFGWQTRIEPIEAPDVVDRTLVPTLLLPPIEDQLSDMRR
jgi:dTDP-4-dehydrorhamnose reductase